MSAMTLKDWLSAKDMSALEMGKLVGLKEPNSIYRWLRGELRPSQKHMSKIVEITEGEVTPNDFFGLKAAA